MAEKTYNWDAEAYAKHSSAQEEWAAGLIEKLNLTGNESLLDLGCGEGKITARIASRLPEGEAIGVDSSGKMILAATLNYPGAKYPNLNFVQLNALDLYFRNRFDIIFSNAVLHWIKDHKTVLQKCRQALKPGGKILFQMGGHGNAKEIIQSINDLIAKPAWKEFFRNFEFPYFFFRPADYQVWLMEAGLQAERIELIPKLIAFKTKRYLAGWIRTTWLPYTERVPDQLKATFISELIESYLQNYPPDKNGKITVKMVRLEVAAVKANLTR